MVEQELEIVQHCHSAICELKLKVPAIAKSPRSKDTTIEAFRTLLH